METMIENYRANIVVDASLKTTFDNICKVNDWWGNIEGPTSHLGDEFTYRVSDIWVNFKITEMIPDKKIIWDVTDCYLPWLKDMKEWNNTSVVFNLKSVENGTEIGFEHVGLTPAVECYDGCAKGWDQYAKESLVKLITEGIGKPGINPNK